MDGQLRCRKLGNLTISQFVATKSVIYNQKIRQVQTCYALNKISPNGESIPISLKDVRPNDHIVMKMDVKQPGQEQAKTGVAKLSVYQSYCGNNENAYIFETDKGLITNLDCQMDIDCVNRVLLTPPEPWVSVQNLKTLIPKDYDFGQYLQEKNQYRMLTQEQTFGNPDFTLETVQTQAPNLIF